MKAVRASLVAMLFVGPAAAAEAPHVAPIRAFAIETVSRWIADPALIEAVRAQNIAHARFGQVDIDALDQQWRDELGAGSQMLIGEVLSRPLSAALKRRQEQSDGLITEIFVMDNVGLNVGQSQETSDYWQGDEPKWLNSFGAGPGAIFIDDFALDESTGRWQSQLTMTIADPATGEAIGAITVGIDRAAMRQLLACLEEEPGCG